MRVNQKDGIYIPQDTICDADDIGQDMCTNKHAGKHKEMDPPLVFTLDSKGRQKMINLLAEHKRSSDHSALNELNRLADMVQKETFRICKNSMQYQQDSCTAGTKNTSHRSIHKGKEASDTYQDYLKTVKQTSFHDEQRKSRLTTMRAVNRHKELQMVLCSSSASSDHLKLSSDTSAPSPGRGDGQPSKEQLAIMYHRLYEQVSLHENEHFVEDRKSVFFKYKISLLQ